MFRSRAFQQLTASVVLIASATWAQADKVAVEISSTHATANQVRSLSLSGAFENPATVVTGGIVLSGAGTIQTLSGALRVKVTDVTLHSGDAIAPTNTTDDRNGQWSASFDGSTKIDSFAAATEPNGDVRLTISSDEQAVTTKIVISASLSSKLNQTQLATLGGSLFQHFLTVPAANSVCSPNFDEAVTSTEKLTAPKAFGILTYSCNATKSVAVSFEQQAWPLTGKR